MAYLNNIDLADAYTKLLDEVWAKQSCSAVLATDGLKLNATNGHELLVPNYSVQGMADYNRNEGFVKGAASLEWETVRFNYERGRIFSIDVLDNAESQNIAFGQLANYFMKSQAIPEADAFTFGELCYGVTPVEATISTGAAAISAIREAVNQMDNDEIPEYDRYLFVSPEIKAMIDDMDTYKSKAVTSRFTQIIAVPRGRFMSSFTFLDGTSTGQEAGGFAPADGASPINFMAVYKHGVISYMKHAVTKIITPELNQEADAWKYAYRASGYCGVPDQYIGKSVYAHIKS
jgi:hypothetical protein